VFSSRGRRLVGPTQNPENSMFSYPSADPRVEIHRLVERFYQKPGARAMLVNSSWTRSPAVQEARNAFREMEVLVPHRMSPETHVSSVCCT
jgi:hypothetical protein